jgi:hypothetical protein
VKQQHLEINQLTRSRDVTKPTCGMKNFTKPILLALEIYKSTEETVFFAYTATQKSRMTTTTHDGDDDGDDNNNNNY